MATIDDAAVREILTSCARIAVLGIHSAPEKAAFYVPEYLHDEGYQIFGVNPTLVGQSLFGEPVRATLAELTEAPDIEREREERQATPERIDLVDVFRRPELIPAHLDDILAMTPRPRVVWFQLGIRNDAAAHALEAAGITVVQDRCTLADHRRLRLGPPARAR